MIEIIPKPVAKLPLWQNILFYFSLAGLMASFSSFFIIDHFQKKSTAALENLKIALATEKTPQERELEKKVFGYQKKIEDFSKIIKEYRKSSKALPLIESLCHPKVWIRSINLDIGRSEAVLSGLTQDFQTLGQQFYIFQETEEITGVQLPNISIGERGEVGFTFKLSLDPKIFK